MDNSLEAKFMKLEKVIQNLQAKANERQLMTPSKIKTKRKRKLEELSGIVESMRTLKQECNEPYDESVQLWTQLVFDEKIKELGQKLWKSQEVEEKPRYSLATLSRIEKRNTIDDYKTQQHEIWDIKE